MNLETAIENVWLEPLTVDDAPAMVELYRANVEHLTRYGDYGDQVRARVEEVQQELRDIGPERCWKIVVDGRFVGRVDLVAVQPPKYGLGYLLDRREGGRGVATESVRAILRHAFKNFGATDVFAGVTHGNDPSVALLLRLGFVRVASFDSYDRYGLSAALGCAPQS